MNDKRQNDTRHGHGITGHVYYLTHYAASTHSASNFFPSGSMTRACTDLAAMLTSRAASQQRLPWHGHDGDS